MNQFYVSIIFIGIILIITALVWVAFDWKKTSDEKKIIDKKKDEIAEVVNGADQMIDEMNKFSDYIVDFMETKSEYIENRVKGVEEKLKEISGLVDKKVSNINEEEEIYQNTGTDDITHASIDTDFKKRQKYVKKNKKNYKNITNVNIGHTKSESDKVIHLTPKSKEVIELAEEGLCDTEIAKRMNIGKGEVQLILGINK